MRKKRNIILILSSLVLFVWSGSNILIHDYYDIYNVERYGTDQFVQDIIILIGFFLLLLSAIFTAYIRKGD